MDGVLLGFMIFLSLLMLGTLWLLRRLQHEIDHLNGYCVRCDMFVTDLPTHIAQRHMPSA